MSPSNGPDVGRAGPWRRILLAIGALAAAGVVWGWLSPEPDEEDVAVSAIPTPDGAPEDVTLPTLVAPEDAAIVEGLLLRLIRGEQVGTFDVTMLCKDGRRVVLEGNVSAHIQEGAPLVTTST